MNPKSLWTKDYLCLLFAVVFASVPHQAITYLVPVYVLDIGGDNAFSGLTVMGLTIAGIVTRLIFGPLIDKVGRKKILVLGSVTFAMNNALYFFVDSLPGLFILRVLNGVSQGIFFPVPPTLAADLAPEGKMVEAMSFFGVVSSLGAAVAPTFGTFLYENYGPAGLFIVMAVLSVVSAILTACITEHYDAKAAAKMAAGKTGFRLSTVVEFAVIIPSILIFMVYAGNSSVSNFLAPYGLSKSIANISVFFLIMQGAMIVTRLGMPQITKRLPIRTAILLGAVLHAVSICIIPLFDSMIFIGAAAILYGISLAMVAQLLQVMIIEMVPENRRGVANSTFMLFGDIGLGVGASIWGVVSQQFGYLPMFLLSAIVVAACFIIGKLFLRQTTAAK